MHQMPGADFPSAIITGAATVVADVALTLLATDEAFRSIFKETAVVSGRESGDSLLRLLPSALAGRLRGLLSSGHAQETCRGALSLGGIPRHVHISAVRVDGVMYDGRYPVYHLVVTDLTGLMEMRRFAALEKKKYALIADTAEDIPFEYDYASDTMRYAEKFQILFGSSCVIPHFRERLTHGESVDPVSDAFRDRFTAMDVSPGNAPECQVRVRGGSRRWFSLFCVEILDERSVPAVAVGTLRDIDRQKREQLRLLDKSRIDAMTGLLNKSTTEEEIREALEDIRPDGFDALLMLDLDNFKKVNDTLGHLAGDEVLIRVARQLLRIFRGEDIIGRVGGDEFHIYMRGVRSVEAVEEKAQEICSTVRKLFINSDLDNTLSLSIGIACAEQPVPYGELFRRADVALYRAKARGKNRYEFFGNVVQAGEEHRGLEVSPLATRVARNSIVVDIVDTLFSMRDMRKGIDKALEFTGNALGVSGIVIFEKSLDFKTISITHEWAAEEAWRSKDRCRNVPVADLKLPCPTVPGGICYCSDVRALPPEEQAGFRDPAVTSFLQCDIVRDDMVVGCISFEERGRRRIWAQQEIDALVLMSKLIGGYISQKQAASLLHQSNEATRDILNSLPGTFVCVISKASHRLLYFNNRVSEQFSAARLGMPCHELFYERQEPCVGCATQRPVEELPVSTLLVDSPFGKIARLCVSDILWENREAAYVALVSEHMPTKEERELQKKKEAYVHALCNTYEYVLDIDSRSGRYEILTLTENARRRFPPQGEYGAAIADMARRHLRLEDRETFYARFALENLNAAFEDGAPSAEMEYRWIGEDGRALWKNRFAFPYRLDDGSPHILTYVRDITAQKKEELRSREEEAGYLLALQSNYSEIFHVDLKLERISPLYYDSGQVPIPIGAADLGEFVRCRAENRVSPDTSEIVRAFYDPHRLRECLYRGEVTEAEYRKRQTSEGEYRWIAAAFRPLPGRPEQALLLLRDISARKRLEEERALEAQRFTLALRDTYTEIYELDIDADMSTLLFTNSRFLRPVGGEGLAHTADIITKMVHPDDKERLAAGVDGARLRACFEQGVPEVTEEFRRLDRDGAYRWVSILIVPQREADGISSKSMLFVKDISGRKAQEQRQRLTEQYFLALRNIYDQLLTFNVTQDTCTVAYHAGNKYVPLPAESRLGRFLSLAAEKMLHPEDRKRFLAFFDMTEVRASFGGGREYRMEEFRAYRADNSFCWVAFTVFPVSAPGGADEIYLVFIMDIDARKRAEAIAQQNVLLERQRFADERYRIIVEQTHTLVFEWCRENDARYVSPGLPLRFAGIYDERDIMRVWKEDGVVHSGDLSMFEDFLRGMRYKKHQEMTIRLRRRDETYIWCKVALTSLRDADGQLYRYIGTLNDVNEATHSILALQYRAEYDMLTGIYNAQTFYARAALLLREHPERRHFILRMDIDRFKVVNDLYGMEEGDRLLRTIAEMLDAQLRGHGICGRISGDVFCACVDYPREQVVQFVHEMTDRLARYPLSSRVVPSFGICAVDDAGTPINMLCDWANLALKTVKGNVLVTHAFYDGKLRERILEEKKIESEMDESLLQGQFQLYLQPKVHIATSRIVGAEGLVRWLHPTEGAIPPDRFIPLFEKNGFIIRLDEHIWEQACRFLRGWLDSGFTPLPVAVNVSRMHIYETRLCEKLCALVEKYHLPPALLELELTESVFLGSENRLFEAIRELRRRGFLFSLDDFGAGYSSLNMLKTLPMETIKIDRGFLSEVVATERGKTVIRHTIALAKDMDMQVIAEGVENVEQAAFLLDAGCSLAQGFYYSPSVPRPVFEQLAFRTPHPFPVDPQILARAQEQA